MLLKSLSALLFTALIAFTASAHTMWMEVSNTGKLGQQQEIKVFFGEFSWGKPTATEKWYSDIMNYQLMMTAPDGTTTTLDKSVDSLCYISHFTPEQEGVYTFWFNHEVKDVYKEKKLTYASAAFVHVGNIKKEALVGKGTYQFLIPDPKKPNSMVLLENGKKAANLPLEVVIENEKEGKVITTDKKGRITLPNDWKGNFLIEIPESKKVDNQMHHEKTYDYDYKVFSYLLKA